MTTDRPSTAVAEIETLDQLSERLGPAGGLAGCAVQSLDLRELADQLRSTDMTGAIFLGCRFAPGSEAEVETRGALVFPSLPDLPFNPYRGGLYSAAELYAGLDRGYRYTFDARVYRWWHFVGRHRSLTSEFAMTLHDHAITEALTDLELDAAIGVMGGHQLTRDTDDYAAAARLGRTLVENGKAVITGGGPGAMEAVNLGAALSGTAADLDAAIALLRAHPTFTDDLQGWVGAAFTVAERWQLNGASYGVPTWLYGHEPPNVFNAGVAKLFSNAIREDVLLRQASGGLVCLPGAAGTVQEVFQAATPRYYAAPETPIPPLVLVGSDYWTTTMPAWPLLTALADDRRMATAIHLVDSVEEVSSVILG